jgi:hypothetical protein
MQDLFSVLTHHPAPPPRTILHVSDDLLGHPLWKSSLLEYARTKGTLTMKMLEERRRHYLTHSAILSRREHELMRLIEAEIGRLS